jgi:hypothetical protein
LEVAVVVDMVVALKVNTVEVMVEGVVMVAEYVLIMVVVVVGIFVIGGGGGGFHCVFQSDFGVRRNCFGYRCEEEYSVK